MKSIIKKEKRMDSMQAKTWKDLYIGDIIRKRRELENKIEYYQTLFEIDCHFGINAFNDILALKSVEKQLLVEADKRRVEQMFFGSNHE